MIFFGPSPALISSAFSNGEGGIVCRVSAKQINSCSHMIILHLFDFCLSGSQNLASMEGNE